MNYLKTVALKNGTECVLRSADAHDGASVLRNFLLTHGETDFLATYPDECTFTEEDEAGFLQRQADDPRAVEICAELDGRIVGTAGISAVGDKYKVRHRAEFGVSVEKACWGLGVGSALTQACIECARQAGYRQLELEAVADNISALNLYRKCGFTEYGRNPRGFLSRTGIWQELVLMRLELD